MSDDAVLHSRYRPQDFEQVIGQAAAVSAMAGVLASGASRAFLFSGPAGTGKTTLARIGAAQLQAELIEVDAATHSGVDEMRDVQIAARTPSLDQPMRAVIIDECHRLSKQAWDSCLKVIEEPPPHLAWFLCTTEPTKVPATVRSRCTHIQLKPIPELELHGLLAAIVEAEGWQTPDDVLQLCAYEAHGSARVALVNLASCQAAPDIQTARAILHAADSSVPVSALCRHLMTGQGSWLQAMAIVTNISGEAEDCRMAVCRYVAAVLLKAKTDREATSLLNVLEAFSQPYHPGEGNAPLLRSVGRCMFR